MSIYVYTYIYICLFILICIYICVSIYMHTHVYMSIYMHIYILLPCIYNHYTHVYVICYSNIQIHIYTYIYNIITEAVWSQQEVFSSPKCQRVSFVDSHLLREHPRPASDPFRHSATQMAKKGPAWHPRGLPLPV